MQRIVIFGNSGAGKSTLAKKLAAENELAHLDLDMFAWLATSPPKRKSLVDSAIEIDAFTQKHENWVIEGCYSDLIELLTNNPKDKAVKGITQAYASEIIFLDLPIETCITHAKNRPWEPHKYQSQQDQDNNLPMLIDWIKAYDTRADTFSKLAHQKLYNRFMGKKTIIYKHV